jgi:ribonucleoside-triphosphate reductase
MLRNRRIGLSITGIVQFIEKQGLNTLKTWMEEGYSLAKNYDKIYSEWFAVPESIKITTVKPSGTLSLLAGVTAGIHFPESKHYIRRVRLAKNSPYVSVLKKSNYKVEPANEDPEKHSSS